MQTLPKFSDLTRQPPVPDPSHYVAQIVYNNNHGYYIPLAVLEEMSQQPNYELLEKAVFDILKEKNKPLSEKYALDRLDESYQVDIYSTH